MTTETADRDALATQFLEQLSYPPYPVQEDAILSWFTSPQGVLVCAPTGTGKTMIAEAAIFEALHTGRQAYYTTPLIALTEQKFREFQETVVRWGFRADDVGLVTGNRQVNPDATVLIVVAEILFNRLLHSEQFDFKNVSAVVMDEFHSFNDPERGIVWEFSLALLPSHVRTLLLSATVGNAYEFVRWLERANDRRLELVESHERKVPLTYLWTGDSLLTEHLEQMAAGDDESRHTPALVFCFNREECWNIAEQLKGKKLLADGQQALLVQELKLHNWSAGAGPKLRQILMRGVGVHHAGLLPKFKRIVEELFQRKLLSVTICTETLAAGINLPARSVVIPNLLKGPPDKKKLIESSAAHQMFGRAGRPQFDTQGFVYALAHEDDVKILRWREKFEQIPDDTKDPQLRKAKKAMKKKMPTRRANQQYWNETHFEKLRNATPSKLQSTGKFPWRMLAYMLEATPEIDPIRQLIKKRLLEGKRMDRALASLEQMLRTLGSAGYVTLEPEPIQRAADDSENLDGELQQPAYRAEMARPDESLSKLLLLRGVNPLYGIFLINHLGIADQSERLQAFESVLELPRSLGRSVRVPPRDELPPGPLAMDFLDVQLLTKGLATQDELTGSSDDDEDQRDRMFAEEKVYALTLAEKLRRLFDYEHPGVDDVRTTPVWVAGEILEFGGDFDKYITSKRLQKQEGVLFRHLLRLILLLGEMGQLSPPNVEEEKWRQDLNNLQQQLTETCSNIDPGSTDQTLAQLDSMKQ